MADTLAEIHKATLQSSDFNSSGETTLFTTNSSTKHVIKSIHVKEGDTNFTVAPTLNVSDHDVVTLTGNATGQEIVGPSTAVKLKTTTFPLRYEDHEFLHQQGSSEYNSIAFPKVNDVEGKTATLNTNNNSIGHSNFTSNYNQRAIYTELGPNNYTMFIYTNLNNQTALQIRQTDGTLVSNYTDGYHPWWYDDKQYAYRYHGSTSYVQRLDTYTGTLEGTWKQKSIGNNTSYARMMGVNDAQGNTKYLLFWPSHNNYGMHVYDFANDNFVTWTSSNASQVLASSSVAMDLLMKSDGSMLFLLQNSTSVIREYPFDPFTSSNPSYQNVNTSNGVQLFPDQAQKKQVLGSRLYYFSDSATGTPNGRLEYIDFDLSGDARFVDTGQTFQTNLGNYGYSVNLNKTTPTSTEISNRTYNISPSFQIRMTGITST